MTTKNKLIKFGEEVEGYSIPVLNEREIRAAAGILFLLMFAALMQVAFRQNFLLVKYVIILFLTDFIIRVFLNPQFSPLLIIARFIVSKQRPEYVGAAQKKFAWKIGVVLVSLMFIHLVVLNTYSEIASIACFVCLSFLFFESAFGICLGCMVHSWFYKSTQYCAGESCSEIKKHHDKKTMFVQVLIILALVAYILMLIFFLNPILIQKPKSLF